MHSALGQGVFTTGHLPYASYCDPRGGLVLAFFFFFFNIYLFWFCFIFYFSELMGTCLILFFLKILLFFFFFRKKLILVEKCMDRWIANMEIEISGIIKLIKRNIKK